MWRQENNKVLTLEEELEEIESAVTITAHGQLLRQVFHLAALIRVYSSLDSVIEV